MIRLLHVITDTNIGGAGVHLLHLLKGYDRKNFTMEVVVPVGSRLVSLLTEINLPYTEMPNIAARSFSWRGVIKLYRYFKKKRPDIVHTHASLSGRVAARLYGKCKIVHTRHTMAANVKKYRMGFINNWLSDIVIAVSPAVKEQILQTGIKKEKIRLVYNGVPPVRLLSDDEKDAVREQYGIKPGVFTVCMIARFAEKKGHDTVLDAAAGVKDDEFLILLAGNGPEEARIAKRIADEGIKNVKHIGFVNDTASLLNIVDVQLNASTDGAEATSMSLLEGMSLGIPAVATHTGGNPYVIKNEINGLLVPERNAGALRKAILRLRNDRVLYKRVSEGAVKRYRDNFTAAEMVFKTEKIYNILTDSAHIKLIGE